MKQTIPSELILQLKIEYVVNYAFGNESFEDLSARMSKKHNISKNRLNNIISKLTIYEMMEIKNKYA